jgi:hypothetical protein
VIEANQWGGDIRFGRFRRKIRECVIRACDVNPHLVLVSPDIHRLTTRYAARLAQWFGVTQANLPSVLPNVNNFAV